jgi:hypothetical protein
LGITRAFGAFVIVCAALTIHSQRQDGPGDNHHHKTWEEKTWHRQAPHKHFYGRNTFMIIDV